MKAFISTTCFTLLFVAIAAQPLARKGSLGVVLQPTEDLLGVYVSQILENGTASQLGLIDGDIILEVNQQRFNNVSELIDETRNWRAGESLVLKIKRAGNHKILKGEVVGKPLEKSQYGYLYYESVAYDGGLLRSILEVPKAVEKPPVVFFLPGIGCSSLDFYYNQELPIKRLVEGLVSVGFAVYRVEKPGMGDSQGTLNCEEMDYTYELNAFSTALEQLKSDPRIDPGKVFLYGHSLGSITAPALASRSTVKGVVVWGGVSSSWYEYSLRRVRDQSIHFGLDYQEIDSNFRAYQPFIYDFLVNKLTPEQLGQVTEYKPMLEDYFPNGDDLAYGAQHFKFVQELGELDLGSMWKRVNCPVLAIHGEFDIEAIDSRWAERIARIVNHYNPGRASYQVLAGTEHGYTLVSSMKENVRIRTDGSYNWEHLTQNFNPELVNLVAGWLEQQL